MKRCTVLVKKKKCHFCRTSEAHFILLVRFEFEGIARWKCEDIGGCLARMAEN